VARITDWEKEVREGVRRENWSVAGPNRIVKVLPFGCPATSLGGYITVGSSLLGKTAQEIERALGLERQYLINGARIYRFIRLPQVSEYEYELTAKFPGGLAFNPAHSNPSYPPGNSSVQQWRIKDGVRIPVDPVKFLDLPVNKKFPYDWLLN
jgi:hypothetical protein